jgi:hypothetical protein
MPQIPINFSNDSAQCEASTPSKLRHAQLGACQGL